MKLRLILLLLVVCSTSGCSVCRALKVRPATQAEVNYMIRRFNWGIGGMHNAEASRYAEYMYEMETGKKWGER